MANTANTKILVVEDEVIVAKTIISQLNQLGYIVTDTASSGAMAIAKVAETQPDLILMDIVLKGSMDGISTATHIREQLDIPIIYLTAYADDSTLHRAKATHPFGYIVKPFTADDLRVAVEIGLFKHQVARELQENRDQLATLLRSMSDGVIATDAEGMITFMNPAAEALTGWHQTEALGQAVTTVFQLMDEVTETPIENPIAKVLKSQQVEYLNNFTALVTKTGTQIPIGDSASPLKRLSGEILGAVVVFWNMSDRRQTELLSQALAKEKELNQLKSQFVSTVSHEFRNPLAIIRTATELLEKRQNLTETQKKAYLQRIKTAVRSMNQLMEDVLFMGQAEADRLVYQPVLLRLEQFCQDLADEFSMFEGRSHSIEFICQGDSQNTWMDEKLLRYILTNLLSNAIKYSPPNTTVQLALTIDSGERQATFLVQDYGIGIPDADQARLFESFFRAENVRSLQGTGLGLAIVKRCVDAHSGHISLISKVGIGTTVRVTLPLDLTAEA